MLVPFYLFIRKIASDSQEITSQSSSRSQVLLKALNNNNNNNNNNLIMTFFKRNYFKFLGLYLFEAF